MVGILEQFNEKLLKHIFYFIIILLVTFIFFTILTIFFNFPIAFITPLGIFATLLSSIVALSILFIMKNEQDKAKKIEERTKELKLIELIFKRLKKYFEYVLEKPKKTRPAQTFPFFYFLSKTNSDLLLKLGIELNIYQDPLPKLHNLTRFQLVLMDTYHLHLGSDIFLNKGSILNDFPVTKELCQKILIDMINYANMEYSLDLDPHLADFP